MNTKILTLGILIALVAYGMNSVMATETSDDEFSDIIDCNDPLYDGYGNENGLNGEGQTGYQRGDMTDSNAQLRTQLKDGSGSGDRYGTDW